MLRFTAILLLVLCCSFRLQQQANETDRMVMKAAEGQMFIYINKIRAGDDNLYGFTLEDDLDECTVGKPYRILTFTSDFYSNPLEEDRDYLVISNEWRVPVKIKGVNRNLLTVSGPSGNYVVTSMGDTTLAKELQMINKGAADNSNSYYLLYIPPLHALFFTHETDNSLQDARFVPLSSAEAIPAVQSARKAGYTLAEVEQAVKNALAGTPEQQPKKAKPPVKKK